MKVTNGRRFIGRLKHKGDILGELTGICKENNLKLGVFSVIGAVTNANLGYYDQAKKEYTGCVSLDKKLEIASCTGNISLKDSEVFIHAHITLADHNGKCYGGHLMPGSSIFAAEYYIEELEGGEFHRKHDKETGLSLW